MKTSRSPRPASPTRTSAAFGWEKAWSSRWRVAIATRAASIIASARSRGARTSGGGRLSAATRSPTLLSRPPWWKNTRRHGSRARVRDARAPENRERDALEQPVARLLGEAGALEQLEHHGEIAQPAAALRDPEPSPPAHAALADRIPFCRGRQQRQRLVEAILVVEPAPGDLDVLRVARGEPSGHRVTERVVERGADDPGIVESSRGGAESRDPAPESLESAVDELEDARVVRIRLQEAERLVEPQERAGMADRAALEALEQAAFLLLVIGRVAGDRRRQGLEEAPAPAHLGLGALDVLHGLVVEAEVVAELVDDRVADQLRHLGLVRTVLFDRPLVDRDRVGQDVAVAGITAREVDAAVQAVQRVGRVDADVGQGLVVGPVLDDHRDVLDLVLEPPGQSTQRLLHERFELATRHDRRTGPPAGTTAPGGARR